MGDPTEELLPLIAMSGGGAHTIADAIDDLATHIVAMSKVLGVHVLVGDLLDPVMDALGVAVSEQMGND